MPATTRQQANAAATSTSAPAAPPTSSLFPIFIEHSLLPSLLSRLCCAPIDAVTLGPFVFGRSAMSQRVRNHERIHWLQWRECLFIFFPLLYALSWAFQFCRHRDVGTSYRHNMFEQEAYSHERNAAYARTRRPFAWMYR